MTKCPETIVPWGLGPKADLDHGDRTERNPTSRERDVSMTSARYSRVRPSRIARIRNHRPSVNASLPKSWLETLEGSPQEVQHSGGREPGPTTRGKPVVIGLEDKQMGVIWMVGL